MAERREEKYILDYRLYSLIKARVSRLLLPDPHYPDGRYTVSSLYFDDVYKSAYYEKADGLSVHKKFRIRNYDFSEDFLRLEKKVKRGLVTTKNTAVISKAEFDKLTNDLFTLDGFSEKAFPLAAEMKSGGLQPAVTVRYQREAFFLEGTDVRLTFDTRVESLFPFTDSLFDATRIAIPAIHPLCIIMEIKYGGKLPVLIRKLCACDAKTLSVSKYALCTADSRLPVGLDQD